MFVENEQVFEIEHKRLGFYVCIIYIIHMHIQYTNRIGYCMKKIYVDEFIE